MSNSFFLSWIIALTIVLPIIVPWSLFICFDNTKPVLVLHMNILQCLFVILSYFLIKCNQKNYSEVSQNTADELDLRILTV